MNSLSISIIVFVVLETSNVFLLYFLPGTKKGNAVGVFNAYEKVKNDPEVYAFVRYLINWVAGTKLIFVALLIVILLIGDNTTKLFSLGALIISIASFFWKLYPAIKDMDKNNQISPKGYSKTLGIMIVTFIAIFIIAFGLFLIYNKG
jgi:hypothetical protein